MKEISSLDQYLNAQAALRDHLEQYEISKEDSKRIISWYLISQDIDEIIECINNAEALVKAHSKNLLIITALWEKMIIGYGKIFTHSDDGYSSLQSNIIDESDIPLHEKLMDIRNSRIAHRGENEFEHHKLILSIEGTEDNCHIQFVIPQISVVGQYGNPVIVRRYLKRIKKKVIERLAHIREKYEQNIFSELGLTPNIP